MNGFALTPFYRAGPTIWLAGVVLIKAAEALSTRYGEEDGGGGGTALANLDYTELARRTLGKYGPPIVDGALALQLTGATCSYVLLIGGLVTSLIVECTGGAIGAWWQSFYFVTPLIFLLLVLPACLVRHFSNLRYRRRRTPPVGGQQKSHFSTLHHCTLSQTTLHRATPAPHQHHTIFPFFTS